MSARGWWAANPWRWRAVVILAVVLAVGLAINYVRGPGTIRYSGTFIATGSMSTPRMDATATLISGGRVLVAGGASGSADTAILGSAEVFDPDHGTFATTGSMAAPRFEAGAVALADGRVLIAGGYAQRGPGAITPTAAAEVYDPQTGTFGPTGSMSMPRVEASMVLLADGRVLVAGGLGTIANATALLDSAEVYDPTTGSFSPTGDLAAPRAAAASALLPDGRVLIAGGTTSTNSSTGAPTATAELYDPVTGAFARTGSMASALERRSASLLLDGTVLVAGGRGSGGLSGGDLLNGSTAAETFDLATGTFSPTAAMASARVAPNIVDLIDGRVLVAGGAGPAELYDFERRTFTPTGTMLQPRYGATATILPRGDVLFAGGTVGTTPVASAELYR